MNKHILIVSSANMDFVLNTHLVPDAGRTVISNGDYKFVPGGKGANSALAVARLGGLSSFCTALGADANGDALLSFYNEEKIDTSDIARIADCSTGLGAVIVDANGDNRIIVFPGANQHIPDSCIVSALNKSTDALFMQLEISYDSIIFAANEASKRNIPIFIDAGPADPDFPLDALPRLTVFSPNESETEIFTGIKPTDEKSCVEAAYRLSHLVKSDYYVIKLGKRGCFITDMKDSATVPTYNGPVVDTTAAGDSFTAALTLEYLRCKDIIKAARYANAVGTLVVGRHGAAPSIPTSDEVNAFIERHENKL